MRRNRWPGSAKISELRGAGVSRLDRDSGEEGVPCDAHASRPSYVECDRVRVPLPRVRYAGRYGRKRRKSR
jgi:hypothetical protein